MNPSTATGRSIAVIAVIAFVALTGYSAGSAGAAGADAPAAPAPAGPWAWKPSRLGIRVVGEVGFGQVTLPAVPAVDEVGGRYAALAVATGFEGEGWVRPQLGLGVRVMRGFYDPLKVSSVANSYTLIEPQLLWRTAPPLFGPRKLLAASWRAGAGLGLSSVHTDRACGKYCDHVYVRADRLSGSAFTGGLLSIGPAGLYVGLRFGFDTSVDWAVSLDAGLGVEF